MPVLIAPSILSADPLNYGAEMEKIEAAGADMHHIDVMDGHFVPCLSFGGSILKSFKRGARKPLDVHMMVNNPEKAYLDAIAAGSHSISFHQEACKHPHSLVQEIKAAGAQAGIAINPGTPLNTLDAILPDLDFVLVMSVNPGFSGQKFIPSTIQKVSLLRDQIAQSKLNVTIQVDGGINLDNIGELYRAGARSFVAGSAIYGAPDPSQALSALRKAASEN